MSILFPVLFPIFVLILIGYLYAKTRPIDMEFANRLNMDVFIPALLIDALSRKSFNLIDYQPLALAGIIVVLLSGVLAWFIAKGFKLSVPMFVPSMMFNNCGNMGLPLAILAWGNEALSAAVVLFLSSNLLHFTLGAYIVGGKISWWNLLKMPVNIATILGLVISFTQWEIPSAIHKPIEMLAQIAIPLMLVALGVRMTTVDLKAWRIGLLGAIVCPLVSVIVAFGILFFMPLEPSQRVQLLMFAALPPAVLNYMFAEKYQQQPTEVASIVVVGNAFSIFVLSLMLLYLG
ncbi:MAG: putative permease [Cocleimonas sp.]|jgi:predicted permease